MKLPIQYLTAGGRRGLLLIAFTLRLLPAAVAQGGFTTATYPTGLKPAQVALGDVNADGRLDLVTANQGSNTVSVLLNSATASGTYASAVSYPAGGSCNDVALGDLNADGRLDIVTSNQTNNSVSVLLGSATVPGTFDLATTYPSGGLDPGAVILGDVNSDGRLDVLTANITGNTIAVLLGAATAGTLLPATTYAGGSFGTTEVALSDVNGDGRPDLIVSNQNVGQALGGSVGVLLASATTPGAFLRAVVYSTGGGQPIGVQVQDINGDGRADIVVANALSSNVAVLLGSATTAGTFGPPTLYASGGTAPVSALLSDINNDGRLDLVVNNQFSSSLSILLGSATAPGTFGAPTTYATGGTSAAGLAVGDVNNDRRPDVIVTNYSNTNPGVIVFLSTYPLATAPALVAAEVSLYPNPAHAAFAVQLPAQPTATPVQADLLDALGRVVRQQQDTLPAGETRLPIEAAGLEAGIYTLRLHLGATVLARRVALY